MKRLRHRASLALWCGNNENEVFVRMWKKTTKVMESNMPFYHNTLRKWVNELDGTTPYWPGSPSSGSLSERVHNLKEGEISGDTHLWQIWHGMRKIEAFREFPTRFCSEFGMESMPSLHTVRMFTDKPDPQLFDPVMMLHQKSGGGNEKMLYYLLAKYRNPRKFEDFVYLSQLVQSDTVRFATDCWRRNIGRQNGSLFWQINDCWPVASWAGIDYGRQQKAIMYRSRHFNKLLCLSNDYFSDRADLYVTNEYPSGFEGKLHWKLITLDGKEINSGDLSVAVSPVSSVMAASLKFSDILRGHDKRDAAVLVTLTDDSGIRDEKSWLLLEDRKARLPRVSLKTECSVEKGVAEISVSSELYARYVELSAEGVTAPWSDNYFDIIPGSSVTVKVNVPDSMNAEELMKKLKIKTLSDVEPGNSRLADKWIRFKMVMKNHNYLSWLVFKVLLK